MTTVSIHGTEFYIDGQPTYKGRTFEDHKIQGLLFNVRAVQATFDDANAETRKHWAYPDTGEWDPDRNTRDFCEALPAWRDHGVLGFTINFQGGGALYAPEIYQHYVNSAFTPEGDLKPAYANRIAKVLECADALGMVPIVGIFYNVHVRKFKDEAAIWHAAENAFEFLKGTGHENFLIEIANETGVICDHAGVDLFCPERAHEMIDAMRAKFPQFLISTSLRGANAETGGGIPPESLIAACDFIMPHGNGTNAERLKAALDLIQSKKAFQIHPKPILINEDSPGIPNLDVAWRGYVSWGYYDQGFAGEMGWGGDAYVDMKAKPREDVYEELSGFQTPPVNWTINTPHKRAFFERVAEITGYSGGK
jgi:hypothetical protein